MSRTIRSSAAAHEQMAARVQTQAQTREDFRRVLARRDSKRAAVRNVAPARAHMGAALANVLFSAALGLAGAASLFFALSA